MTIRNILLAAVLVATTAAAQQPPPRAHNPQERIERLAVLLDLTDAQKAKVAQVMEEQRTSMEALREQDKASSVRPTREQMQLRHEHTRAETQGKLKGILSAEQLKKFDLLSEGPPHGPMGRHHDRDSQGAP